jgi:hypothetical protein
LVAAIIGTSPDKIQLALDYLCSPDPESRSKLEDGRRLVKEGQFMYRMVNFAEYRERMSLESKAEYMRNYRAEGKDKSRNVVNSGNSGKVSVRPVREAEAEAEAEADKKEEVPPSKQELNSDQIRLGKLFSRKPSTRWSAAELKSFRAIGEIDEEDFQALERYYGASWPEGKDYRRRNLITLLNNFAAELDKVRNWQEPKPY